MKNKFPDWFENFITQLPSNSKKIAIKVKVIPGSNHNKIIGIMSDQKTLKIKIKSPAEKGKANQELVKFISEELEMKLDQIEIKSGLSSSHKFIEISLI